MEKKAWNKNRYTCTPQKGKSKILLNIINTGGFVIFTLDFYMDKASYTLHIIKYLHTYY